ncbi:unnamed protein product [Alternaria alternata]
MSAAGAPEVPIYAQCARTGIPALVTPECVSKDDERAPAIHCTNIAVAGGVRYSTWFGGSYEGSIDTKIWFSKNVDGKWTKPRDIAGNKEGEEVVYWNPVLFIPDRSRPQELHVFFKKFTPIPVWVTFWTSSSDGGETWSVARELVPGLDGKGGRGPQKNPPIVLSNGDWLSVGSYEVTNPPGSEAYGVWTQNWGPRTPLCLAISEDDGKTWKLWATLEDAPPPDDFKRVIALETGIVNDGRSEFS